MSVKISVGWAVVLLISTIALFGSVYGNISGGFDITLVAVAIISALVFIFSIMNLKSVPKLPSLKSRMNMRDPSPIATPNVLHSSAVAEEAPFNCHDCGKVMGKVYLCAKHKREAQYKLRGDSRDQFSHAYDLHPLDTPIVSDELLDDFDKEYSEVTGTTSVETEAPDFDKYYETGEAKSPVKENTMSSREQYHAQISREMAARETRQEVDVLSENERRKKAFYAETKVESAPVAKTIITTGSDSRERGQSGNVSKAGEHSGKPGVPTIPYEPSEADYSRLRGLVSGNAPKLPPGVKKGEDGFGATPSSAKAPGAGRPTEPTVFPPREAVSVAASDHRPAPHPSSLDYMDFTQSNTVTPYGTRFWDQFYEDDITPPIMKIKFMPAKASLAFNRLRRIYLINLNRKPGVNLLGVNLRVKKSAPPISAPTRQGIEPASDKHLRERIEELRRGGSASK
jgi:hypothetical protein